VTDRWQKFTDEEVCKETLDMLEKYCDEFLIHAVDVEGKSQGIEKELVEYLGKWCESENAIPITYAGGVHSYEDIDLLYMLGNGKINVTIGSALDIFGGKLSFNKIIDKIIAKNAAH
jgi:phosphoribosylformimino-5-aminoimidazole carboxamide ribotide isomerase